MKSFEEEFPSYPEWEDMAEWDDNMRGLRETKVKEYLEKHCLDKERVKEAIEKHLPGITCDCGPLTHCLFCYKNAIKKELGL